MAHDTLQTLSNTQNYLMLIFFLTPFFTAMSMFVVIALRKIKSRSLVALQYVFLAMAGNSMLYIIKFFFSFSLLDYSVMGYHNLLYGVMSAPVFYFYFVALLRPWKVRARFVLVHLSPAMAFVLASFTMQLLGCEEPECYMRWSDLLANMHQPANVVSLLMLATYLVQTTLYIAMIVKMLYVHRKNIKHEYSYTDGVNLKWANWALLAYVCYAYMPMFFIVFENLELPLMLIFIAITIFSLFLLFFAGYHQPLLYPNDSAEPEVKFGSMGPAPESRDRIHSDLIELFEVQKRYREVNLSINDVAKYLNTNRTYVSKIINEAFGMNFYAFVNRYRMSEFMQRMQSEGNSNNFKIREVSEQVGFKSYTSFYNFFKEQTGYTPSEYLKKRI